MCNGASGMVAQDTLVVPISPLDPTSSPRVIWKYARHSYHYIFSLGPFLGVLAFCFFLLLPIELLTGSLEMLNQYGYQVTMPGGKNLLFGISFLYAPWWLWLQWPRRRHDDDSDVTSREDDVICETSPPDDAAIGSSLEVYTTCEEQWNERHGQRCRKWAVTLVLYTPYWLTTIFVKPPFEVISLSLRCIYAFASKTGASLTWLFIWCLWRRGCQGQHGKQQKQGDNSSSSQDDAASGDEVILDDEFPLLKHYNYRWNLYRRLPLRSMSRAWGRFNQLELPVWLGTPSYRLYIWLFNVKLEEAAVQDLRQYRNLSEFFMRRLRPGVRHVDGSSLLTSPADGRILHLGRVEGGVLEQVKGVTYSLKGFLGQRMPNSAGTSNSTHVISTSVPSLRGNNDDGVFVGGTGRGGDTHYTRQLLLNPSNDLYQCIVYLGPGDYHCFHSPADWEVICRRHFPGELYSVNPGIARWLQGLFNFNERAVYFGRWRHGFFSLAAVGATNVGSIYVHFDQALKTNMAEVKDGLNYVTHDVSFSSSRSSKGRGIAVTKGEQMGGFNLGSTVVLLFEAPRGFAFDVAPGETVKYGQALGGMLQ